MGWAFQRSRSKRTSEYLACITVLAAVGIMFAPFRGESGAFRTQSAAVIPLLNGGAVEEGQSFHRRHFAPAVEDCAVSQFRSVAAERLRVSARREIVVAKRVTPLEVDFDAPRTEWKALGVEQRRRLDALIEMNPPTAVLLHGSGSASGSLGGLLARRRLADRAPHGELPDVVLGNGDGSGDGVIEIGSAAGRADGLLEICLVGDFLARSPSAAQWASLDEVLDYLAIRIGRLPVRVHEPATAAEPGGVRQGCLGPLFPKEMLLDRLNGPAP